ncbi:MAG: Kdo2-lipid lauroyltransferase/acyltransferase [Hyphomicrobiales bacterium]|jgi:KDO2-lipid IV(A) lauroyltransferase|nr:Kdo2-lipid lauroyltransferase/acyltransferase [Hyphomicrobiales bacterium]
MARRGKSLTYLLPLKRAFERLLGWIVVGTLAVLRRINRQRMANVLGALMRFVGPWLPEHKIGRENLRAAFPEKSTEEIEAILGRVWENLGRVAAEFAHIDRIIIHDPDRPERSNDPDVMCDETTYARLRLLGDSARPNLVFAAHLANWEIPALAPHSFGFKTSILYRRPNIGGASDAIVAMRARCMGNMVAAGLDAPLKLARALESGENVALLVDQHTTQGIDVTFFGRKAKANHLVVTLARLTGAPIRGVRVIRQPDGNHFVAELTDEIPPVRDAEGKIDTQATLQAITGVIEGWVREHPEQWLWLHRRWR